MPKHHYANTLNIPMTLFSMVLLRDINNLARLYIVQMKMVHFKKILYFNLSSMNFPVVRLSLYEL